MGDGDQDVTVYTKEDFLTGTAPYEEVYRLRDNPFEFQRAISKMSDIARLAKVQNFKKLFGEYCKSMRMIGKSDFIENASNFEDQEIDLATGEWCADEYGISRINKQGFEEIACVHPLMPTRRFVDIDTGFEKIEIAYKKSKQWRKVICERGQLAESRKIVALANKGVAVTSENARLLVQYIHDIENLNYDRIPESNSTSRLGWVGDNQFSPYVEGLIYDGNESFEHFYKSVGTKGSYKKWLEFVREIRAEGNIPAKIVLAASFASVLVAPCNCSPFFVHLWNGTGNGKTVALMLAASVWGDPRIGNFIHTFNSTDVGQEQMAGFVNSLPLMLDELQIQNDKKDFDRIIYKLAEGTGRTRGSKNGGIQRMQTWRNCILTTGERPIATTKSGGGAINRIIEINTQEIKFFKDAKKTADFVVGNYGHAGKAFVNELMKDGMLDLARKTQSDFFKLLSDGDITEKQIVAASLILTADAMADMLIFQDGNGLTVSQVKKFLVTNSEVSVGKRAYEWLLDWLVQNNKKFKSTSDAAETWGKTAPGIVHIVRSIFDKACVENGYDPTAVLSYLKQHDLIETDEGRYVKRTRVGGMRCQCVVLKTEEKVPEGFHEVPEGEQVAF